MVRQQFSGNIGVSGSRLAALGWIIKGQRASRLFLAMSRPIAEASETGKLFSRIPHNYLWQSATICIFFIFRGRLTVQISTKIIASFCSAMAFCPRQELALGV
jgi:hypothetical protein